MITNRFVDITLIEVHQRFGYTTTGTRKTGNHFERAK